MTWTDGYYLILLSCELVIPVNVETCVGICTVTATTLLPAIVSHGKFQTVSLYMQSSSALHIWSGTPSFVSCCLKLKQLLLI